MEIVLQFNESITDLAGNRMGNWVYREQIASKLNGSDTVTVMIPERIDSVASSFVEGVYKELGERYGRQKAEQMMILKWRELDG